MSTIHLNARSLSENLKSISNLVEDSTINFDLIGITETKIKKQNIEDPHTSDTETDVSSVKIPGYQFVHIPLLILHSGVLDCMFHRK